MPMGFARGQPARDPDGWTRTSSGVPGGTGRATPFIGDYFGARYDDQAGTFAHVLFVPRSPTLQDGAVAGGD